RDKEKECKTKLALEKEKWEKDNISKEQVVSSEEIAEIVSSWTGIPAHSLTEEESKKLLNLENILHKRIVGQNEAVNAIAKAIKRGRVGLKDPKRPIGSFVFLGPTGVGKTELCKALAESLFASDDAIIKLDMSEYMEKHSVSKLVGSPPGYVGFDEGGQLTEKIRRKPYSVILFDEIEKAHPDVMNILLQILDEGKVTDAHGRNVNFQNTVIVMTSNAGSDNKTNILGFDKSFDDITKEKTMKALSDFLRPEFLSRVDEIIIFENLKQDAFEK
ncbi:MAG: AAA family ATPase, partial [Oscillospiraceae bacterium]